MDLKSQVLLKIKLENTLKREINTVFNFMIMAFKLSIFRRELFNVYDYRSLWRDLLIKHYKRVQRNFLNIHTKKQLLAENLQEQNIALALEVWSQELAEKTADDITKTNLMDVRKAMEQAQEESIKERLTPMELALAAAVILKRRFKSRMTNIVTTETNSAAENTKIVEASLKSEIISGVVAARLTQKIWTNVGDSRVREAHVAAGGQVRKLNEPFSVGGELLMYPSDRSFGASIGNIANCRCSLTFK